MIPVKTILVQLYTETGSPSDLARLRGFLTKRYPQFASLHNHTNDGGFRYVYPEVQFKLIDNKLSLIGTGLGFKVLYEIFKDLDYIEINHKKLEITEKSIQLKEEAMGESKDFIRYKFISPWMALNQKNYRAFIDADLYKREQNLNRILWGNLKTIAHAFEYWIPDPEKIKVNGHFKMKEGVFKGNKMLLFFGEFIANFLIPDYLGLGKQVARGYGTVIKTNEK